MKKKCGARVIRLAVMGAVILAVCAGVYYLGLGSYFSFESLKLKSILFKARVHENYMQSALIFIATFCGLILLTLPVVAPMTLLGGYLFGLRDGFFFSLFAMLIRSLTSFLVIRYVVSSLIREKYQHKLDDFNTKIKKYGYSYLVTLQLLSIVPFVVINTLAALAGVSAFTVFWTTLAGSIPVTFVYTLAGQQLASINSPKEILSGQMFGVLMLLAALACMPMIIKIVRARREKQPKTVSIKK